MATQNSVITVLLIIASIIFLGVLLKNNYIEKQYKELVNTTLKKRAELIQPYYENIYNSNKINEVNKELLDKSLTNYEKALKPSETGFIPPFFTFPQSGSTFYEPKTEEKTKWGETLEKVVSEFNSQEISTINEFNRLDTGLKTIDRAQKDIKNMPMFESFSNEVPNTAENLKETGFVEFIPKIINNDKSLLTGLPLEREHLNMVPFFGSNIKQNAENFANTSILDTYTGRNDVFFHKIEQGPMFPQVKQEIYGLGPAVTDTVDLDRFIPSNFRQNEKPFEPLRIPAPKEGSIENNIRPIYKDINELRPGNKPKLSYEGRTVDGQKSSFRGEYGEVFQKNTPRESEFTHDMYLKGQSDFRKPQLKDKENYKPVLKCTSRMNSEQLELGPSRPEYGLKLSLIKEENSDYIPFQN